MFVAQPYGITFSLFGVDEFAGTRAGTDYERFKIHDKPCW